MTHVLPVCQLPQGFVDGFLVSLVPKMTEAIFHYTMGTWAKEELNHFSTDLNQSFLAERCSLFQILSVIPPPMNQEVAS